MMTSVWSINKSWIDWQKNNACNDEAHFQLNGYMNKKIVVSGVNRRHKRSKDPLIENTLYYTPPEEIKHSALSIPQFGQYYSWLSRKKALKTVLPGLSCIGRYWWLLNRLPVQGVQGIHVTQSVDDTGDIVLYVISKAPGVLSNVSGVEESKLVWKSTVWKSSDISEAAVVKN